MIPVKKNEIYIINIKGMTHEGQGVGKVDGFTVFVDGPVEGEKVEVKIIKVGKSFAAGKMVKILEPSPHRTKPVCGIYKRCGGCSLQHMSYEAGLEFKTRLVSDSIRRIGKIDDVVIHNTIGMKKPMNYRNKAQYPVGRQGNELKAGFYARRSHDIIDCVDCMIQDEVSGKIRSIVKDFIIDNDISVYDESTGKGFIRHIMTRTGFKTGEIMVVLVVNGRSLPHNDKLVKLLISQIPQIESIVLNVNTKKTNVIMGNENLTLYGKDTITDYIGRFKFNISPISFFQVNPIQTEVLYGKALEYAGLTGNETVFDLYCGIGTISLFLSEKAKKVYGVEVVEAAVMDARENALLNGVENVEFMAGEAEKLIPEVYSRGIRADVVVVDPPRKGCDEILLETLVNMKPERIVYVSCNPATLARDLNYLAGKGFKAVEVQPVDMFPWTPHVESIIMMTYCGQKDK